MRINKSLETECSPLLHNTTLNVSVLHSAIVKHSCDVTHYWNHINGVRPTFLRLFQMMTGSVAPKDIGLTDKHFIRLLCERTDKWCHIVWLNNQYVVTEVGFAFSMFLYISRDQTIPVLMYGIPNSTLIALIGYYFTNIYFFQLLFFLIICLYLKHKINR